jgi:hypothetical protein
MSEDQDYVVNHFQTNVSSEWSQKLVELLWNTQEAMFNAKQKRNSIGQGITVSESREYEQLFDNFLERLVLRTKYKFQKKDKVETPEPIKNNEDVANLPMNKKEDLVDKVTQLMEELEFTSVEKQVNNKEGYGREG